MPRITSIGVGGFKSIKNLQPFPLGSINIFVGANGSGKSNLISFLRLIASIAAGKLQDHVGQAGGANTLLRYGAKVTPAIWIAFEFEGKARPGKYISSLRSTETDSLVFSQEEVEESRVRRSQPPRDVLGSGHKESLLMKMGYIAIRDTLAGIQTFHFHDTSKSAPIRLRGYIEDSRQLREDGGNLAAFLYGLKQRKSLYYERIVASIRSIAPFFDDFDLAPMNSDPNSILLNWRDRDSAYLFGPHQLSDGTLRSMALVALLAQPEDELPGLIALDEPEIGLHPYAVEIVAALVKSASVHRPIILATQSVALVNQFDAEEVVTVTRENSESKFARQNRQSLDAWLDEYAIGDLWEKNLIGGNPSR